MDTRNSIDSIDSINNSVRTVERSTAMTLSTWKRLLATVLSLSLLLTSLPAQAGKVTRYVHTDHLGSPAVKTDSTGAEMWRQSHSPYGEGEQGPTPDGPGYTGHRNDAATGLVYMQARYYDPQIGRFLSVDPVTFSADKPEYFNRYWYAAGNPYKYTDPDGRCILPPAAVACIIVGEALVDAVLVMTVGFLTVDAINHAMTKEDDESGEGEDGQSSNDEGEVDAAIPDKARAVLDQVKETGEAPPGYEGGRDFKNREGKLPEGGSYKEYDVDPKPTDGSSRNSERIVVDQKSGRSWYTSDHYGSFKEIK